MGGVSYDVEGLAGEMGVEEVLERGERDASDLLSCSHCAVEHLPAGGGGGGALALLSLRRK